MRYFITFTACFAVLSMGLLLPVPQQVSSWLVGAGSVLCFTSLLAWCVVPPRKTRAVFALVVGIFGAVVYVPMLSYLLSGARRTTGYDRMSDVMTESCISVCVMLSALAVFYGLVTCGRDQSLTKPPENNARDVT